MVQVFSYDTLIIMRTDYNQAANSNEKRVQVAKIGEL
jgi:hypothetical protein